MSGKRTIILVILAVAAVMANAAEDVDLVHDAIQWLTNDSEEGDAVVVRYGDGIEILVRPFGFAHGGFVVADTVSPSASLTASMVFGAAGRHHCHLLFVDREDWLLMCRVFPFPNTAEDIFRRAPEGFDLARDTAVFLLTPEMCRPRWVNGCVARLDAPDSAGGTTIGVHAARELATWDEEARRVLQRYLNQSPYHLSALDTLVQRLLNTANQRENADLVPIDSVRELDAKTASTSYSTNFQNGGAMMDWIEETVFDALGE